MLSLSVCYVICGPFQVPEGHHLRAQPSARVREEVCLSERFLALDRETACEGNSWKRNNSIWTAVLETEYGPLRL